MFNPYYLKGENRDLVFRCIGEDDKFFFVICDEIRNIEKYIQKKDTKFEHETTEKHILSVFSIGFDSITNPLLYDSNEYSKKGLYDKNQFYYPVKIKMNWLLVRDDNDIEYWIKWKNKDGKVIIELFYDA